MKRWITLLTAAAVLSGCVTTREVVYREPYRSDGYYAQAPAYEYERQGDSYYSPAYSDQGDYYVGAGYGASNYGWGVSYFDYPVYYSVFWPINRWYYDPFAYPGYYYGVTWFPRSYFSLSLGYGGGWRSHGWLSYSPYRYSWVDNYYDWRPWYDRYPSYRHHYPTPRYGDARVEASRLADLRRPAPRSPYYGNGASHMQGGMAPSHRGNSRAPDYGTSRQDVRRVGAGAPRATPNTGVFGNPTRGTPGGSRIQGAPRSQMPGTPTGAGNNSRNEVERFSGQRTLPSRGATSMPSIGERQSQDRRGYDLPATRTAPRPYTSDTGIPIRGSQPKPQVRELAPAAQMPARSAPVRGGIESRPVIRESMPVRNAVPVRETAPVREAAPVRHPIPVRSATPQPQMRSMPSYTPAPSAPAPVMRGAPVRSAPVSAPSRMEAPTPVSRPAPVESRSEGSSQRGNSDVRRTGSSRDR